MRNVVLHRLLESFTVDAAGRLSAESAGGAEMPFELVEERAAGRVPLYCYRPLTGEFIRSKMGALAALPSHAAATHASSPGQRLSPCPARCFAGETSGVRFCFCCPC